MSISSWHRFWVPEIHFCPQMNPTSAEFQLALLRKSSFSISPVDALFMLNGMLSLVRATTLNHDGKLDILIGGAGAGNHTGMFLSSYLGDGTGNFTTGQNNDLGPGTMEGEMGLADFNEDGNLDVAFPIVFSQGQTESTSVLTFFGDGNGKFTDVTREARLTDPRWSTGAAFGDYDGDGFVDLMITRYVEFDPKTPPIFGEGPTCHYRGISVQCGPRGMKGLADSLYHNNRDGTFTEVSTTARVQDSSRDFGLGVVWSDFNDNGRPDLFVADDSTPNQLYRNDGKGLFSDVSFISGTAVNGEGAETAGMGIAVCDYNHSGRFSLVLTTFEDQAATLYSNDGGMNFADGQQTQVGFLQANATGVEQQHGRDERSRTGISKC